MDNAKCIKGSVENTNFVEGALFSPIRVWILEVPVCIRYARNFKVTLGSVQNKKKIIKGKAFLSIQNKTT